MCDHLLELSQDDSKKWSKRGFGQEITQVVSDLELWTTRAPDKACKINFNGFHLFCFFTKSYRDFRLNETILTSGQT